MKTLKEFKKTNGDVYAKVEYDAEQGLIKDTWKGYFGTSENFRAVVTYVADQIEEKKIKNWLADLRDMQGPFQDSAGFLAEEITPRAFKAGLEKEAVVLPANIFSQLSAESAKQGIKDEKVRMFENMDEARQWLNN